jgi:hypothetical protein
MNNNFRQNPEYFFFKTKRESFRNQNLLEKIKILRIEINENGIINELINEVQIQLDKNSKSISDKNEFINSDMIDLNPNKIPDKLNSNCISNDLMNPIDKIKMIIKGNIKEYIPKTFKIIIKDNKND